MEKTRIDKWLWAARFFKTRTLATEAVNRGRVQINRQDTKPSRDVRVGDMLTILQSGVPLTVVIQGISEQRGPASLAQLLYEETRESIQKRALATENRRLSPEPAHAIPTGRPTKRDRRDLQRDWDNRWSARMVDE